MTVHPDYAYWDNALAGTLGPVHDGDPQCGFYRRRKFKDGPLLPVAIWRGDDGVIVAMVGQDMADADDLWTWVCDKPVTEAAYRAVLAGGGWGDEPRSAVPSNMPSDPFEALQVEFAAEQEVAAELLAKPVTGKDHADQIAVLTKRLSGIKNRATDLHKVEKQPSLDEGRKVDTKWRDLKEDPDTLSKSLKRHLDAYLMEQQRIEQERQRAARIEADRIRQEAEDAHFAAEKSAATDNAKGAPDAAAIKEQNDRLAEAERLAEQAAAAERDAQARNASAGRTGAKVALRTFVYGEITNFETLLMALKDRPEIQELVQTLANRAAKSGFELPGMAIKSEQRAA